MSLVSRNATTADAEALQHIWSWVYAGKAPEGEPGPLEPYETALITENDGVPAAAAKILDLPTARGRADLSCGGIGGVATLVEHRGSGVAGHLMRFSLREMLERGYDVSCLYGFRDSYYRKLGYEVCGWRWKINCPQTRLPKTKDTQPWRHIGPDQLGELDETYHSFIRGFSGSVVRSPELWQNRMGKQAPAIYTVGDPVQGYCWTHLGEFWTELKIGEMAWSSWEGYESLLALIRSLAHNMRSVTWCEPPSSPFLARYFDEGVTAEMSRETMFRAINVPQALGKLKPTQSGSFRFSVEDSELPENDGPWQVEFEPGQVHVSSCEEPDFIISVQHFSQALMGSPGLSELMRMEVVSLISESPEPYEAALRLLDPVPVVCMDFF